MSPILGTIASSTRQGLTTSSYESIATVTVGAGGSSSISFSSIPSTFKHLQVRFAAQTNRGTYGTDSGFFRLNSDTGSNYVYHNISGDGSSASAGASTAQSKGYTGEIGTSTGSSFGVAVIDFLDYTNTNKYKTVRTLSGVDINGTVAGYGGYVILTSTLWQNTNAISTILIYPNVGTQFNQYSSFALYGIKG